MKVTFTITEGDEFPLFSAEYGEPSVNADGTPMTNLKWCSVWYSIDGRETEADRVQALSPNGGSVNTWPGYIAVRKGEFKNVTLWATATAFNGNTGDKSVPVVVPVDRTNTVPGAPI